MRWARSCAVCRSVLKPFCIVDDAFTVEHSAPEGNWKVHEAGGDTCQGQQPASRAQEGREMSSFARSRYISIRQALSSSQSSAPSLRVRRFPLPQNRVVHNATRVLDTVDLLGRRLGQGCVMGVCRLPCQSELTSLERGAASVAAHQTSVRSTE